MWDSGLIEGGTDGTCSFTFEEPGTYDTYEYFCGPRKEMGMVGTVTVSGGSARASASASATGSASASAGAETLSDTGGPPLALVAALFLAGSGLVLAGSGLVPFAVLRPQGFIGFIFGGGGEARASSFPASSRMERKGSTARPALVVLKRSPDHLAPSR